MSLRRLYHRRFRHRERFHLAVLLTIVVVAYGAVPEPVAGAAPPRPAPRAPPPPEGLQRRVAPDVLGRVSWEALVDILLLLLVAVVWLTLVPARAARRRPPAR